MLSRSSGMCMRAPETRSRAPAALCRCPGALRLWPAGRDARARGLGRGRTRQSAERRLRALPEDGDDAPFQEQAGAFAYRHIAENLERLDLNQLQTALATAIAAEDYDLAAAVRDRLATLAEADGAGGDVRGRLLAWEALLVTDWVADRAARLGLRFPTEVQRRAAPVLLSGSDAVIQSETGSGKTAAFLLPSLSRLTYPPQRYVEDMKGPQLLVLVPTFELGTQVALFLYKLYGGNISSQRPGDAANIFTYQGPRGIKVRGLLTDGDVDAALQEPRWLAGAHVLVGTPPQVLHAATCDQPYLDLSELEVVVADEVDELMRAYPSSFRAILDVISGNGLEGDDLREGQVVPWPAWHQQRQQQQQLPQAGGAGSSDAANASSDAGASQAGEQAPTATPSSSGSGDIGAEAESGSAQAAAGSGDGPRSEPSSSSSGLESTSVASRQPPAKPQVVLVGATITDAEMEEAVRRHWVTEPVVVRVGAPNRVPKGLRHRALVVEDSTRALAALVAMLRRDLTQAGQDEEPARVIVFAASDAAARAAADPLRSALWSEHQLSVLLPSGAEPVKALHAFRDRAASLLLATPSASRGLDLPAVSHVYNLGPPSDAREYLHRAGRAGRIGSTTGGLVTSIVTRSELERLCELTTELGILLAVETEAAQGLGLVEGGGAAGDAPAGDLDKLKRGLEDIYRLL